MRRGLIWIRRGRPLGVGDSQRLLLRRKSSESPGISFALIESVVGDLVGADGSGDERLTWIGGATMKSSDKRATAELLIATVEAAIARGWRHYSEKGELLASTLAVF